MLLLLSSRLILFAFFQSIIFLIFQISGNKEAWSISAGWWPFSVLFTNIITIFILNKLYRNENTKYFQEIKFTRHGWWKDFFIASSIFLILVLISQLLNVIIANVLWGNVSTANNLLIRSLPLWAVIIALLFPITQVFAELPFYFGYLMPRLEKKLNSGWNALIITSGFLALQHITLPLIFDIKFIMWRGLMYLPFAFFLGLSIKNRPRFLPYFMVGHGLIDAMVIVLMATAK